MREGRETEYSEADKAQKEWEREDGKEDRNHFESTYILKKNVEYETANGCRYKTDRLGRIKECSGMIELESGTTANKTAQRMAGGSDRHNGERIVDGRAEYDPDDKDDGGHLIARMFGGSPEADNLVAMNYHVNRGEYKRIENKWKNTLKETDENGERKYDVQVKISVRYEGDSQRPTEFRIQSVTYNRKTHEAVSHMVKRIKNEPGGNT